MPAPKSEISTLSSIAHMVARALEASGVDSSPIFAQAGIDLSSMNGPESRVDSIAMQKVWHGAVLGTKDPCFGVSVAENIQPSALHGLGFSWIASDCLKDALQRLARYYRVLVTAGEIILEEHGDDLCLWLKIPPHDGRIAFASLDAALGVFLQMCRLTAGANFSPDLVELQREAPPEPERLLDFFDCPVSFGSAENRIFFNKHSLESPLPTANAALARVNDQIVMEYLARFDQGNIVNQVRAYIIEQLPSGLPSQESAAQILHLSLRSLQRKLQGEGTSFKTLLDDIRQSLAEQYLNEQQRSVGEITYLLGFTEPSNFTRAFKRWTGMSPVDYRASTN